MTGQEELLALLGKIVAQWNYAEHCSRQIIRKRLPAGDIDDQHHIQLSKKTPKWMEEELRDEILPAWSGALGEPYLRVLIEAFSAAREYRNHYVHGVWATVGSDPAQAVILPSKPHDNRTQLPDFATADDMRPIAFHLEQLGLFACEVGNAFGCDGERASNPDGTPVVGTLPVLISALPPFQYKLLTR